MAEVWVRDTRIVDVGALPSEVVAVVERRAIERGVDWSPRSGTFAWATDSTTEVGRLRKRTRTVRSFGVVDDDVLAWTVSDDGAPPAAIVVRRSRVDVADGATAIAGLSPELLARAGPLDTSGVTVRGDLGGRELANAFIGLGAGPAADRVRAVLLGTQPA